MIMQRNLGTTLWVDLTNPNQNDIARILSDHSIDLATKHLLDFDLQPHFERHTNYSYCVLRFPRLFIDQKTRHRTSFEVDFIIRDNLLITIHDIPLFEMDMIMDMVDAGHMSDNTEQQLMAKIINKFYSTTRKQLLGITENLEKIELEIFENNRRETIEKISATARTIIDIQRSLRAHRPIISAFESLFKIQSNGRNPIDAVTEVYDELIALLSTNQDILVELRQTHNALLAQKTNSVLTTLTVVSFLAVPLSVTVDLTRVIFLPELGNAMPPILGLIAVIVIAILYKFHKMTWI